ncbi:MAG: hypothetical protein H7Z14_04270 [Anaerolineae bacterium]|nr:hypothetical protein [Phycisphaerae bacterium]
MFERRLKIFLSILFVITAVLVLRAAQLQIIKRSHWSTQAVDALKREVLIETTRGTIYDAKGKVLAQDVACIDACVDFRALTDPPDDAWVTQLARSWARQQRTDEWRAADADARKKILDEEKRHVLDRIKIMWATLARLGDIAPEQLDEIRHDTVRRVVLAKRNNWFRKYKDATKKHAARSEERTDTWWRGWLIDETQDAPQLDDFDIKMRDETDAHPLLKNISSAVQNKLGKDLENYPGLELRPGMTRLYLQGEVACHVVGNLSRVRREDLETDPNRDLKPDGDLRKYQYTDLIGRSGLEGLCEPLLRGTRGRIEKYMGEAGDTSEILASRPGADVHATIDIEIQRKVLKLFQTATIEFPAAVEGGTPTTRPVSMHGGAVLIDLHGGEVRALVSNPTFDPNTFDTDYPKLVMDSLNQALMNRATQYPLETGSTIKPVVGIGGITQGVIGVNEGIECIGFLVLHGRKYGVGRCWVATRFEKMLGAAGVSHHPIPTEAPHRGTNGNADGFLTFTDAVERSCNVYFETVASRLGLQGLSYWMDKFGLGRPTGIGIAEARGRLPNSYDGPNWGLEAATWFAGIGQGPVAATPIQMANVSATIARDGVWMRPTLLEPENSDSLRKVLSARAASTQPSTKPTAQPWWTIPDRVDLDVSPAAMAAAQTGMYRVVNSRAGSGSVLQKKGSITVAGKTGTAEAAPLRRALLDNDGQPIRNENGRRMYENITPSTVSQENPMAPWYIGFDADGKNTKHSWIIGFAPAENPQVAFAVMVEYGGGGGGAAAHIARGMLDAAIQQGYLSPDRPATKPPADLEASGR